MADNLNISEGTGKVIAADDISSVLYQRVKLIHGADGVNAGDVSTANPYPVVQTGTPPLPTGAATSANQATANGSLASIDGKLPAALGGAGGVKVEIVAGGSAGGLTDTQLRATAVPVSGTVTATGPLTDTQLRATAVPVSAASLPLPSGASTAAKQPALGTAGSASADVVTVQGIASMTALKVDGSAVTQPVSAASLPLPSGAATAAKQPALGTAGTASADVLSVQGVASMTALKVDGSAVTQPVSGTVTANAGTGTRTVAGDVAHDGADSGNPVKVGGKARTDLPTAVAASDRTDMSTDPYGRPLVTHVPLEMIKTVHKRFTSAQTGTALITPTTGKKIAITHINVTTGGTTAGRVILWFGATGDTTFTQDTDDVAFDAEFAPSATAKPGFGPPFFTPIPCQTADFLLRITTDAALTCSVLVKYYEWV